MKKGVLFAILSSLIFSMMNALVKAVSLSIPSTEIVFFRSIIGTLMILALIKHKKVPFSKSGISMLILRGGMGALYMVAYFYTISKIPLIDAIVLVNLSPIFVAILAVFFLKEKVTDKMMLMFPITLTGIFLIIKPFNFTSYSVDALVGVLTALFSAGAAICIRYLTKKHHTYEIIFYFMAVATAVSVPLMWQTFVWPNGMEWFYLCCIGIVSLLAQVFLTKAFTHENAIVVEIVRYIGIVFNAAWGFVFWREYPDFYTVLGGSIIIYACISLSLSKEDALEKRKKQLA